MGLRLGAAFGSIRWLGPMDYHLNQQGKTVGVFPLEELRRRRNAGELTGSEFVWCEGMPAWQSLDAVLQQEMTPMIPVPPPLPKPASKVLPFLVIAAVVVVAGVVLFGIVAVQSSRRLRHNFEEIVRGSGLLNGKSAFELASEPIHWTSNTVTTAKMLEKGKEFRIRQYLESYQQHSAHNPAYDADALQLISTWIDYHYSGKLRTNYANIVRISDRLATNLACDDPLVLTVTGANINEMHEASRRFTLALKYYEHSRYQEYPRLFATVMLANYSTQLHGQTDQVRQLEWSAKQLLKGAFRDGTLRPEDQAEIADILVNDWGNEFFVRNAVAIVKIVEDAGKPYQWLALTLEGEHQIDAAWEARGGGYANTVTAEGWKGFAEHLAKARASLTKAWELRPDLPLTASRMMTVALGSSDIGEMRQWFDHAVAAQVDYPAVWKSMRWGLRPRWYGSHDAMLAFGVMALNTHRFDTDVPRNLFVSISDLESDMELPLGEHIYGREDIWPHLQEMYEGYIAEPKQAEFRDGWRTTYAAVAFLAGKYNVARTQLEAIGWQPWRSNLANWGRDLSFMPLEVAARTSAVGQQIDAAEKHFRKGNDSAALRLYTDLDTATNIDERTREFIQDRLATLQLEQHFQSGEWIDFLPTGNKLAGWTGERGKFTAAADGALEVQSDEGGHIIFSRAPVGSDFEVRGSFEVVRSSSKAFQAGVMMGMPQFESPAWYGFRVKRNADEGDVVAFAHGWTTTQLRVPVTLNSETNSFTFRFHHGQVSATVNDKQIFKNANPPATNAIPPAVMRVGLGAYGDANETVIRYRNVQIRKLSAR